MHLDLKHMEALAAVLSTGSFETAAKQLNLTASALSQRVRTLEERIGCVLVVRGAPCVPTVEGRRVWQYAQDIALREHQLISTLGIDLGQDLVPVSIAITPDTLATWFISVMRELPDLVFELKVDNAENGTRLLSRGDVLAAVTFGQKQVHGCDAIPLGALQYLPVCSPKFFDKWFKDMGRVDALKRAPCLTYNSQDRLQIDFASNVCGEDVRPPAHYIPDARALAHAAIADMGWVLIPHLMAQPYLDNGQLVLLSEEHHAFSQLTWQVLRSSRKSLNPLTQVVRSTAKRMLIQSS